MMIKHLNTVSNQVIRTLKYLLLPTEHLDQLAKKLMKPFVFLYEYIVCLLCFYFILLIFTNMFQIKVVKPTCKIKNCEPPCKPYLNPSY